MSARPTILKYNGIDLFASQPTPFVTISNDMISHGGKRWGQNKNIDLAGQITGVDHAACLASINSIVASLAENFKDFEIYEDGSLLQTFSNCKIQSIDFSKGQMAQLVDYSISLSNYENFKGQFGIINPSESFSFSQNQDKTVSLTHESSAQGFKTGGSYNNAFDNAKSYVSTISGWNSQIAPAFINGGNGVYPILLSVSESINRFEGTYSVTENYILSENASSKTPTAVISATSYNYSVESDVNSVEVDVTCQGGKDFTLAEVRSHAQSVDLHQEAVDRSGNTGLLVTPVSITLDEDESSKTVTIKATFDDDKLFVFDGDAVNNTRNAYLDSSVSVDSDELTGMVTFNVSSSIIGRGNGYQRWQNQLSFLSNNVSNIDEINRTDDIVASMRAEAEHVYSQLSSTFPSAFAINKRATSLSLTKNEYANEISISATFDNRDVIGEIFAGGNNMSFGADSNYSVKITPSLRQFRPNPSCTHNGHYLIYDLNSKVKEKVDVDVNVVGNAWAVVDNRQLPANGSLTAAQSAMQQNLVGLGNTLLSNIVSSYIDLSTVDLMSESQNFNQHGRTYSINRSFQQDQYNLTVNDNLQYMRVNTNG